MNSSMNREIAHGAPRRRAHSERAFTLLEVLVAMFVLGMSISTLFALMSRSLSNVERMQIVNRALMLGQSKMNEILISHRTADGGGSAKNLEVGDSISGQWDELTRWEATAGVVKMRREVSMASAIPVQIQFTVYWKRNPGGKENAMLLETTRLWSATPPAGGSGGNAQ